MTKVAGRVISLLLAFTSFRPFLPTRFPLPKESLLSPASSSPPSIPLLSDTYSLYVKMYLSSTGAVRSGECRVSCVERPSPPSHFLPSFPRSPPPSSLLPPRAARRLPFSFFPPLLASSPLPSDPAPSTPSPSTHPHHNWGWPVSGGWCPVCPVTSGELPAGRSGLAGCLAAPRGPGQTDPAWRLALGLSPANRFGGPPARLGRRAAYQSTSSLVPHSFAAPQSRAIPPPLSPFPFLCSAWCYLQQHLEMCTVVYFSPFG